jgi:hypothetical protein
MKALGSFIWGNLWCMYRSHRTMLARNVSSKKRCLHEMFPQKRRYLHQMFSYRDNPCTFVTVGMKNAIWPNFRDDICNLLVVVVVVAAVVIAAVVFIFSNKTIHLTKINLTNKKHIILNKKQTYKKKRT